MGTGSESCVGPSSLGKPGERRTGGGWDAARAKRARSDLPLGCFCRPVAPCRPGAVGTRFPGKPKANKDQSPAAGRGESSWIRGAPWHRWGVGSALRGCLDSGGWGAVFSLGGTCCVPIRWCVGPGRRGVSRARLRFWIPGGFTREEACVNGPASTPIPLSTAYSKRASCIESGLLTDPDPDLPVAAEVNGLPTGSMKTSAGLGIQTPQLPRKGRGCRVNAKASYVDESLFGSHAGQQSVAAAFDPPWVDSSPRAPKPLLWGPDYHPSKSSPPATTPRKRNKYRLKNHTPSYCDETLFGPNPGGEEWAASRTARCEVAKLRPLLWTPPSAPRDHLVLSSRPKEALRRAVHRDAPNVQEREGSQAWNGGDTFRKPPKSCSGGVEQGALRRPRSQSLSRQGSASDARATKQKDPLFPVSSRRSARATGASPSNTLRPPWK